MKQINIGNENLLEVISNADTVADVLRQRVNTRSEEEKEDAFFVCSVDDIINKHNMWVSLLPRVEPHYAVKCNNDVVALQTLANLGIGFDCASKTEIRTILDLGVHPDKIVYANPCKQNSHLKYAAQHNIALMTFDNENELLKIKNTYPSAKLILRILPGEFKSQCQLGCKYGCHPRQAPNLLQKAKKLGLNVVGVSFHVGSGCLEAEAFPSAVALAREVFDEAIMCGFKPTILDIGGGFPGQDSANITFQEICARLNPALDKYFPEKSGVRIIAEPGRYYVASAYTLCVNVIAKRVVSRDRQDYKDPDIEDAVCNSDAPSKNEEPAFMYYVNDGVYGSFNCLLYDHASVTPKLLQECPAEPVYSCSVWGPTCDGLDCITNHDLLPELDVGDWIVYEDMGAYTMSAASTFNGMAKPKGYYIVTELGLTLISTTKGQAANNIDPASIWPINLKAKEEITRPVSGIRPFEELLRGVTLNFNSTDIVQTILPK